MSKPASYPSMVMYHASQSVMSPMPLKRAMGCLHCLLKLCLNLNEPMSSRPRPNIPSQYGPVTATLPSLRTIAVRHTLNKSTQRAARNHCRGHSGSSEGAGSSGPEPKWLRIYVYIYIYIYIERERYIEIYRYMCIYIYIYIHMHIHMCIYGAA